MGVLSYGSAARATRIAVVVAVISVSSAPVRFADAESSPEPTFEGGYPKSDAVQKIYDQSDFDRAVEAYRFFYPTVSAAAIFEGSRKVGLVPNQTFGVLDTKPKHVIFTANSDTPYGPLLLDLKDGPMVVEIPPGPMVVVAMDLNQRWVADMGLPGPDGDKGGAFVIVPPGFQGDTPAGMHRATSTTNRVIVGARALPVEGDVAAAMELIRKTKVHPLNPPDDWAEPTFVDLTPTPEDTTPLTWENGIKYWLALRDVIETEPAYEPYKAFYGQLASLGIVKGKPFIPDPRMKSILERAARTANAQMRAEAFADRRADRVVWPDRKWEWAALRSDNGDFDTPSYVDLHARDKWFFQAIGASPAMFRREPGAGSVYWLAVRDRGSVPLDGGKSYQLTVPLPVPAKLFWSVTVYDAETRSQIKTDQGTAALRSLFELKELATGKSIDLYFGPQAPEGKEKQFIKTLPGKGWFAYFRVYGPEAAAFDGKWKPGDLEATE